MKRTIFDGQAAFIYLMTKCTGGNPPDSPLAVTYMLEAMQAAGLRWATPKVADGVLPYNRRAVPASKKTIYDGPDDVLPQFFQAMKNAGRPAIGWQYIYGNLPIKEAEVAAEQITKYKLEGFILDPEIEYQAAGRSVAARQYMRRLRQLCPNVPLALCSWRFPTDHTTFPWSAFLDEMDAARGDVHMPQMYWEGDTRPNAASLQLARCLKELKALEDLPILPVGAAYGNRQKNLTYWMPTAAQMSDFSASARTAGCTGILWWVWDMLVDKDTRHPTDAGKQGWWKVLIAEASRWQLPEPPPPAPDPEPEPPATEPLSLESLDRRVTALEERAGG